MTRGARYLYLVPLFVFLVGLPGIAIGLLFSAWIGVLVVLAGFMVLLWLHFQCVGRDDGC